MSRFLSRPPKRPPREDGEGLVLSAGLECCCACAGYGMCASCTLYRSSTLAMPGRLSSLTHRSSPQPVRACEAHDESLANCWWHAHTTHTSLAPSNRWHARTLASLVPTPRSAIQRASPLALALLAPGRAAVVGLLACTAAADSLGWALSEQQGTPYSAAPGICTRAPANELLLYTSVLSFTA
jgi:hypothetical protein